MKRRSFFFILVIIIGIFYFLPSKNKPKISTSGNKLQEKIKTSIVDKHPITNKESSIKVVTKKVQEKQNELIKKAESVKKLSHYYDRALPKKYKKEINYIGNQEINFKGKMIEADIAQIQIKDSRGNISNFRAALNSKTGAIMQTWGHDIKESPLKRKPASSLHIKPVYREN